MKGGGREEREEEEEEEKEGSGGGERQFEEKGTWYLLCFSLPSRRAEARAGLTSWAVPGEMGICP